MNNILGHILSAIQEPTPMDRSDLALFCIIASFLERGEPTALTVDECRELLGPLGAKYAVPALNWACRVKRLEIVEDTDAHQWKGADKVMPTGTGLLWYMDCLAQGWSVQQWAELTEPAADVGNGS